MQRSSRYQLLLLLTQSEEKMSKVKLGTSYWKLWSATAISNLGDGVSAIAYLWLASAVTRSPILIAIAGVASRLPWLIFTLPAGVITDRFDRRKIIVSMDLFRFYLAWLKFYGITRLKLSCRDLLY